MANKGRIIRNTAYLSSAFIAQKVLSFVYFTMIARLVGVTDTGAYVFALSYSTLFSVFVDFGLAPYIQREIAKFPEKTKDIVKRVLRVKMFYALAAVVAALVISHFLGLEPLVRRMIYVALVLMVVDSFNLTMWSAFRGHHQLKYEAASVVVGQLIVFAVGLTGLLFGASLEILIIALLCGSTFIAIFAFALVRMRLKFWAFPSFHLPVKKELFTESIPFGLSGVFTRGFSSIDSVFLKQLAGPSAVGFYSVPNKIVFALQFIPSAFAASIYPAMSHYYKTSEQKMVQIFEQAMLFLLLLSVPTAVGIFVLTEPIIREIYTTEFLDSVPAMYILVWGVIFGFIEWPVGSLLNAIGQQRKNTITRGTVLAANVILNLILIPVLSFLGAAIAAVTTYALLTIMGLFWVHKYVTVNWRYLFISFLKIAAAAAVMGGIIFLLLPYVYFVLLVPLGVIIYGFFVLVFRVISMRQFLDLLQSFKRQPEPQE